MGGMKDLLGDVPYMAPPPLEPPSDIPTDVYALFERLTFDVIRRGFKRYSSDAILHRIRWHFHVEQDQRDFKCNDHWTAHLSRWFMKKYPEHNGFFETRIRKTG